MGDTIENTIIINRAKDDNSQIHIVEQQSVEQQSVEQQSQKDKLTLSITTIGDLLLRQTISNGGEPINGVNLSIPTLSASI